MELSSSRPFGAKDWIRLASALVCAGLIRKMLTSEYLPGAGLALAFVIFLAAGLLTRGERRPFSRLRRGDAFMALVSALLSAAYAAFMSVELRFLLFPVTCACIAWTLFSASGRLPGEPMSAESLSAAARRLPGACFQSMGKPFAALSGLKKTRGLLAGALISVPVVIAAAILLTSADDVFASFLSNAFRNASFSYVVLDAFMLVLALAMFSFLFSLGLAPSPAENTPREVKPQAVFALPVALLDALYAVFVGIQLVYLFGGQKSAAMQGGYAEYARKGFFELALVSLINLTFSAFAFRCCGFPKALRWLSAGLYAATAVLLASSAMRMGLYVRAYGLSFLRLLTFWGIFAMAVADIFAAYRLIFPGKKVFSRAAAVILVSFVLLVYMNPEARVAAWNIRHTAAEAVDAEYLSSLSPDALLALDRLSDSSEEARRAAREIRSRYESVPAASSSLTRILTR